MQQKLILNTHADTGAGAIVHHAKAMELNPNYRGIVLCDDGCGKAGDRKNGFNRKRSFELVHSSHNYEIIFPEIAAQLNIPFGVPVQKIFVMACNTLWISCHKQMAKKKYLPGQHVIGISDPLVKGMVSDYTANCHFGGHYEQPHIALFGTQRTIDSRHYQNAIQAALPHAKISAVACPNLASLIDQDAPVEILTQEIDKYVGEVDLSARVTHVGLVCTHYSAVEELFLNSFWGDPRLQHDIKILDHPGLVEQSRLQYIDQHIAQPGVELIYPENSIFVTTGDTDKMNKAAQRIQNELSPQHPFKFVNVKFIHIGLPLEHIIKQASFDEIIDLKNQTAKSRRAAMDSALVIP